MLKYNIIEHTMWDIFKSEIQELCSLLGESYNGFEFHTAVTVKAMML
jgi:hypothetical protein